MISGQKLMEIEATRRRSQIISGRLSYKSSSSEHSDIETELDKNLLKLLAESQTNLERTEALRQAHPQLLRPEDYVRFRFVDTFHDELKLMVKRARCGNNVSNNLVKQKKTHSSDAGHRWTESETVKGFRHYVTFVLSYVIFLFIVTFLMTRFLI